MALVLKQKMMMLWTSVAFTTKLPLLPLPATSLSKNISFSVSQVGQATAWEGSIVSASGSLFSVFQLEVAAAMEHKRRHL